MDIYCAFLRGVNVNGKTMKMADARSVLTAAGFEDVTSVLASGNLIFRTDRSRPTLRTSLEEALSTHYRDTVSLFVKSAADVAAIVSSQPFDADPEHHVYAFVCDPGFEDTLLAEFATVRPADGERATVDNGHFFWRCRKGATLDSGFSSILGRAAMRTMFTSRNMNTMRKVAARMA